MIRWLTPPIALCLTVLLLIVVGSLDATAQTPLATANWPAYGGGNDAGRYSPLTQIDSDNVSQLQPAWTHHSGDYSDGRGEWAFTSLQVTPIVVDTTLYYCTPFGRVFALDAETGTERWVYDPQVKNKRSGLYPAVCRGVSWWSDPNASGTAGSP